MAKITYTNKVALNENPEIALINKVTDDDLNQIKSVVNTNDDNVGDLTTLTTTTKTSTVAAINELQSNKAENDIVEISNTQPSSTSNKIWIDTGEIGSAVSEITNEYSTSTGLGYSANYVNNLHTYSTDEIRVGTWLGKPLYRKVIQTTIPTSGNNQNVSFQNNVAIMKSVTGFALQSASGGVNLILPYISMTNSWSIYTYYNRANQELVIENSGTTFMNNTTCYLIAEYTKTTD